MLKNLLFTLFLLLCCLGHLMADNEDGKKPKKKEQGKQLVIVDSTMKDHIKHMSDQSDDTLVFEDWDDPEIGNGDNSAIDDGGTDGSGDFGEDRLNHVIGDLIAAHRSKKYEADFEIFPNPAVSVLNLRVKDSPTEVRILSLNGELILRTEANSEIDISALSAGLYFIQMVYPDHIESKKFVKS